MKTAEQMLAPVMKLAGERETGSGNNTTVNRYWGVSGQPYCVYTVLYADKLSGDPRALSGYGGSGNCRPLGEWLTAKGWRLSDNSKAQKGDIAFYCQYNEHEKRWMYQHVFFIFEKISGTQFITLEGNTQCYETVEKAKAAAVGTGAYEGIGYKKRDMPTSAVWQIFHPPYAGTAAKDKQTAVSVQLPQLRFGDTGNYVESLQLLLNGKGFDCGKADGVWGAKTDAAVLLFQRAAKLTADKICGKDTWTALMGY